MVLGYERDGDIVVITLDRADVLNAFDDQLGDETIAALRRASGDDAARCVVITGAGRAFSSGEDLGALGDAYARGEPPDLGGILQRRYNPLVRAVRGAPKPVVAAMDGVAAGAGAALGLACDFRIASERARLVLGFARVGLAPDSGALWSLSRIVGAAKAYELAVSDERLTAEDALELGLLTRVVPAERFEDEWRLFASELASGPTRAYALTKKLLDEAGHRSLDEQLDAEVDVQGSAGRTQDHLEGVRAFLEKRPPRFTGR
jgi:2-(1,2-epoxy-1,2-dihydrophenyl)acetyl-CoA isomerase